MAVHEYVVSVMSLKGNSLLAQVITTWEPDLVVESEMGPKETAEECKDAES